MSERRGVPLYYRVMRALREAVVSGEVAPGGRLPTESDLMARYGVSRVVVRQALGILEEEGLIYRVRGKGTFVSEDAAQGAPDSFSGYLEDLIRRGLQVAVEVLDFGLRAAPTEVAAALGLAGGVGPAGALGLAGGAGPAGSGEAVDTGGDAGSEGRAEGGEGPPSAPARVLFVKRLRSVEEEPFAVVDSFIPEEVGARLRLDDLRREPLMRLLETRAGVVLSAAEEVFEAAAAGEETARLLRVDPLAPVLKMTLTAYSVEGRPVNLEHVYFRADRYHHRAHFKRRRGPGAVAGWVPVDGPG